MNKALEAALAEITAQPPNNSQCWTHRLPDDALELLYAIEGLMREGKRVHRQVAAEKFNELFDIPGKPITDGMISNHLAPKGKGCVCWKDRDYL